MLRSSGGYRTLRSFRTATVIYDTTVSFCSRFVDPRSRIVDQMVQAARSGRQNIAEGSRAAATSSQTELRLVNVARSSLDELLLDYEDYLRQNGKRQWEKDDAEAKEVREVGQMKREFAADGTDAADDAYAASYSRWSCNKDPAIVANLMICLIHQTNYLLDKQIGQLEQAFISDGGYSEQLAAARLQARDQQRGGDAFATQAPFKTCPNCGRAMVLRTARKGKNAGSQFLGCSRYPECKGALDL